MPDHRLFRRRLTSLGEVFDFLGAFAERERLDERTAYALRFAAEELFTNMLKYNHSPGQEIAISVDRAGDRLVLELTDFDVAPFDPESLPAVDVAAPLESRVPGGLGLHLVKSMFDHLSYDYQDGNLKVAAHRRMNR